MNRRMTLRSTIPFHEPMRRYANPVQTMDSNQVRGEMEEHLAAAKSWREANLELDYLRSLIPQGYEAWASQFSVKQGGIIIELLIREADDA